MSTRAYYSIGDRCFYIHYDGYPEGAAEYIAAAVEYRTRINGRDGLTGAFYRANATAEFADLPAASDTDAEYHYRIDGGLRITVQHRQIGGDRWSTEFSGPLSDWLNATITDGRTFTEAYGNVVSVQSAIENAEAELSSAATRFEQGHLGNAHGAVGDAWRWIKNVTTADDLRARIIRLDASMMPSFWKDECTDVYRWIAINCDADRDEIDTALSLA